MSDELVLTNARVVTATSVLAGTVTARRGRIVAVESGRSRTGVDLEGDYLVPGFVELHTDNLERHVNPRPKVLWPTLPALVAHDAELAAAGVTTVLDALRVGDAGTTGGNGGSAAPLADAIAEARDGGRLRCDHFLHLRCEIECANAAEEFALLQDHRLVRLVSLMDHTPGQRQFRDVEQWKIYYRGKYGMGEAEIEALMAERREQQALNAGPNLREIVAACRARRLPMASHDDTSAAHIDEAVELGVTISEFPTTMEAALAAKQADLSTIGGAPNVVRGKSHSGNVAALELAQAGCLDALSSDYVPQSLAHAAFRLNAELGLPLAEAIGTVSAAPARMVGFDDRGAIAPGLRADLAQISVHDGTPIVRRVWREGVRIV